MLRKLLYIFAVLALTSCSTVGDMFQDSGDDAPLEGERLSVLELQKELEPDSPGLEAQGFIAPEPWRNEFWPQAGGYPNHAMQNLALSSGALRLAWKSAIGRGASAGLPLTAQPIMVDNVVYTLDSNSNLSAFDAGNGKKLWTRDIRPEDEDEAVIGGGIAYSRGQLYATGGYNEILALNPVGGQTIWRVPLPAPARAAPTIMDDRVFVTTLDNRITALSSIDGALLWEFAGISETAGLIGAASPAADREVVVPAFSSGEIFALRVENGSVAWADSLSSLKRFAGRSALSDIRGLPVIDKGIVFAVSFSGRTAAIDARTGRRIWQREIGGPETPWIAGNHLFLLTSESELVALGRESGAIRWVVKLPKYQNEEKRSAPLFWTGPLLAGSRLIVAASDGRVIEIEPESGAIIREWNAGGDIAVSPLIANETLYLLTNDGSLMAYK